MIYPYTLSPRARDTLREMRRRPAMKVGTRWRLKGAPTFFVHEGLIERLLLNSIARPETPERLVLTAEGRALAARAVA